MKPYINEFHKESLRKWLTKGNTLKEFMRRFPQKDNPQTTLDNATFKYVSFATGLDYSKEALIELYEFLKEEGHLYYDGEIIYSLIEMD